MPMSAPLCCTSSASVAEVLGDRLGLARKAAVGLEVDAAHPDAEPIEERQHGGSAGAANAIERDVEFARLDRADIDLGQARGSRRGGGAIAPSSCDSVPMRIPAGARRSGRRPGSRTALPGVAIEEDPVGPDELERVPFDRIVAGREDQPGAGTMMLHRHLHGRRRHHADVDHVDADRLKPGRRRAREHLARVRASRPSTTRVPPLARTQAPSAAA